MVDGITNGKEILATIQSLFVTDRNNRRTVGRADTGEQRELLNALDLCAQRRPAQAIRCGRDVTFSEQPNTPQPSRYKETILGEVRFPLCAASNKETAALDHYLSLGKQRITLPLGHQRIIVPLDIRRYAIQADGSVLNEKC